MLIRYPTILMKFLILGCFLGRKVYVICDAFTFLFQNLWFFVHSLRFSIFIYIFLPFLKCLLCILFCLFHFYSPHFEYHRFSMASLILHIIDKTLLIINLHSIFLIHVKYMTILEICPFFPPKICKATKNNRRSVLWFSDPHAVSSMFSG